MKNAAGRIFNHTKGLVFRYRLLIVTAAHLVQAALANYLAFFFRFDGIIPAGQFLKPAHYLPFLIVIRLLFYYRSRLYSDLWRYSSIRSLIKITVSVTLGTLMFFVLVRYAFHDITYPRSIYVLDWTFLILLAGGTRFSVRILREHLQSENTGTKVLIIGAGDAGELIVRDMKNNPQYGYRPIGFLDDSRYKKGLTIHGVPIFGPMNMLESAIEKHGPEEILICIPSAGHSTIRRVYERCKPFHLPIKILPGMSDILKGDVSVSQIKPLSMEDLLQREPVKTDIRSVKEFIEGKAVLVTGAGGSIGSELCRQILNYAPSVLVMLDRYENGLFQIDSELGQEAALGQLKTVIGDILDRDRMESVFRTFSPRIVFHAAAHKHVPLMEENPVEAVKNNIFGTRNMIELATRHGVENFVMVSTDKAVNPTNVMGATKRSAEFLVLNAMPHSSTKFTTVRFGNVLGSNGSVFFVFKEQIRRGGPVTVTHPDMKRFFMLIPEAVQLVLVAASAGKGGEIFVLDMGEPVRIVDFAENLIRLSGFVPYEEIDITFSGLRPGEKLYEELFDNSEEIVPTVNEKLKMAVPKHPSAKEIEDFLQRMERLVKSGSAAEICAAIQSIVPGFRPSTSASGINISHN